MNHREHFLACRRAIVAALSLVWVFAGISCDKVKHFTIPAINHQTTWVGAADHNEVACEVAQVLFIPLPAILVCPDHPLFETSLSSQPTKGTGVDLGIGDLPADQIAVGFARYSDAGTEPCPCWAWSTAVMRGEFTFDTFLLPGGHSRWRTVVAAALVFRFDQYYQVDGAAAAAGPFDILGGIFVRTPPSPKLGPGNTLVQGPNNSFTMSSQPFLVPFPKLAGIGPEYPKTGFGIRKTGNTITVDVSNQVRSWITDKEPNLGFLIIGRDEALPHDGNQTRIVQIADIHLEVDANPQQ
jgi:hypothetical protein